MTSDAFTSDEGSGDLSEDALNLYWYFADSRTSRGLPKRTRSHAQNDFGWKWSKVSALMQEIEDAGFWCLSYNGTPEFSREAVPERPGLLVRACDAGVRMRACLESKPLTTNSSIPSTFSLRENSGRPAPPVVSHLSAKGYANLARRYGRDVRDLVDEFSYLIRKSSGGFAPGGIDAAALGANFKRWLTVDQTPYSVIREMMKIFVEDYAQAKKGAPAWKLFLSQREKLFTQAKERSERQELSAYWKSSEEAKISSYWKRRLKEAKSGESEH